MIARNERVHIADCLASVDGLVHERIVVDTGSEDGTQDIARAAGARVIQSTWENDFSLARNLGLEQATGDYILVLDADERLRGDARRQLSSLFPADSPKAFTLVQSSQDVSGQRIRVSIARLFPNDHRVRFEFPIHEQVDTALARAGIPLVPTEIEIEHLGYADPAISSAKIARNRAILERALAGRAAGQERVHLQYYKASSFYDEKNWQRAAEEFARCLDSAPPGSRIHAVASLRAAECMYLTGRLADAAGSLPSQPSPHLHPAALCLGGQIAAARGDTAAARSWYEETLGCADRAYLPPVNVAVVKFRALSYLADYWSRSGRSDAAVALLRICLDIRKGTINGASPEIALTYRRCLHPQAPPDLHPGLAA